MPGLKTPENEINKMCVYMKEHNVIFMPVGKVASASIRRSMVGEPKYITKDKVLSNYMSCKRVAVIRNPFDRLVSLFSFMPSDQAKSYELNIEYDDFDSFIRAIDNTPDEIANCHFRSQVNLLSQDNVYLPTVTIDFDDLHTITDYLPIKKLEWYDRTKSTHGHYSEYYDEKLIKIVNRRFAADLQFFNYSQRLLVA